ncbi:hypothetical protein A2G06_02355 [Geobacter anodireducens]|nr:hypothetical protein A2G06_02355 [Geobacter anodireducens]
MDPQQVPQAPPIHDDYRKELWNAQKSSHEQYDKALLTFSGGGLAISLALVKDLFPADVMVIPWLLVLSWGLFCTSIVLTVMSFLTSQKSISVQLDYFEKFVSGDLSYWNKKNPFTAATIWLNRVSGGAFVSAVIAVTVFSAVNMNEVLQMTEKTERLQGGVVAPPMPPLRQLQEGASNGQQALPRQNSEEGNGGTKDEKKSVGKQEGGIK